ncbi:hypothetical protein G3O06_06235 [Burkholderia sp. Ac-20345]|uniref:hypothetical protein n=1 Tax=Burkholderia sp. Ac-20345 TaxID=2703891 RepID=UPI00197C0D9E|nr:hypothetical protein [Burkholderia sp. Ac-20345]MBN3777164.1 hypothetical protein [Burkholderia sp. Ac-20345]
MKPHQKASRLQAALPLNGIRIHEFLPFHERFLDGNRTPVSAVMGATGMQLPDSLPQIGALGTIIAALVDLRVNRHAPQKLWLALPAVKKLPSINSSLLWM